jgi:hypothetical protein
MTVQAKDLPESKRLWALARDYDNHPKELNTVVFSKQNPYARQFKAFVAKSNAPLAKQRRKDGWILAGWIVGGVSVLGAIVFLDVVFFDFAILKFLGFCVCAGFLGWCLYSLISEAVADGVRRGRE